MSLAKRLRSDEQGTSLVILVLSLVVLLGFAAIAIDAAGAWALRRQDQSAADTGAIAGAIFTAGKTQALAIADATDEVIRITYNTVDPDMTQAEWTTKWNTCVDTAKPGAFTLTGTSDCISFTANLDTIRVMTPDIPWETSFGKVLGFDEIGTDAFAEVETELADNGGVLPFAMPGAAGGDGEVCLKSGANPKNEAPCDGPDTGNFGFLDFTMFGDPGAGIPSVCQGGNDRLENNIASGIDHPLGAASSFPASSNTDRDACNDGNINAEPWHVRTKTGNVAQALDDGLVDVTGTGTPGRLTNSSNTIDVRGHVLDNTGLWGHFNGTEPATCSTASDHDAVTACLTDPSNYAVDPMSGELVWNRGVIFNDDISDSPRFGWVPLIYENSLGPGGTTVTIEEFRPVYIQTTFWGCNASSCSLIWDPGEGAPTPGPNNKRVEAATALKIPFLALPERLREAAPGTPGQVHYLISR